MGGPDRKAEMNSGSSDGKGKYQGYLRQTRAMKLRYRLDMRDDG